MQPRREVKTNPTAQPSNIELELMISNTMRRELNDPSSYSPIGTRIARHPEGFAYVHEFRAKNGFGALVKDSWGFLYSTNHSSWTFYTRDALPDLLKDITIDPDLVK